MNSSWILNCCNEIIRVRLKNAEYNIRLEVFTPVFTVDNAVELIGLVCWLNS